MTHNTIPELYPATHAWMDGFQLGTGERPPIAIERLNTAESVAVFIIESARGFAAAARESALPTDDISTRKKSRDDIKFCGIRLGLQTTTTRINHPVWTIFGRTNNDMGPFGDPVMAAYPVIDEHSAIQQISTSLLLSGARTLPPGAHNPIRTRTLYSERLPYREIQSSNYHGKYDRFRVARNYYCVDPDGKLVVMSSDLSNIVRPGSCTPYLKTKHRAVLKGGDITGMVDSKAPRRVAARWIDGLVAAGRHYREQQGRETIRLTPRYDSHVTKVRRERFYGI